MPGTKTPATPRGFLNASCDPVQINAWWAEADYNVALSPEDMRCGVVDIDGAQGEASWASSEGGPETYRVRTPSGGIHDYYAGSLPPSQNKVGEKIDTRGRGSYVLVPPSIIDDRDPKAHGLPHKQGVYTLERDIDYAPLPAWVSEAAGRARAAAAGSSGVALDLPGNVARAREWLSRRAPAVEGNGGDAWTFETFCFLADLGLSVEKMLEVAADWNSSCVPPWDDDGLRLKAESGSANRQNEVGAWALPPSLDTFAAALDKLGVEYRREAEAPVKERFHLYTVADLMAMPPLEFLVPEMIPEESICMLFGPPDAFKTFALLTQVLPVAQAQDVVFVAGEGGRGLGARINAWCTLNEVERDKIHLYTSTDMPVAAMAEDVHAFIAKVRKSGVQPAIVCIDTAARSMFGLEESSAKDAGQFLEAMDTIKRELRCTVVVIHHSGKDATKGARGSSAFQGGFDAIIEAEADTDTMALSLTVRKMKDAERRKTPWLFKLSPLAGSLVLSPITAAEHKALTVPADPLDTGKIAGALVRLKAFEVAGEETFVTTFTLAHELLPETGKTPEDRNAEVSSLERLLASRGRRDLASYITRDGRELRWRVPA